MTKASSVKHSSLEAVSSSSSGGSHCCAQPSNEQNLYSPACGERPEDRQLPPGDLLLFQIALLHALFPAAWMPVAYFCTILFVQLNKVLSEEGALLQVQNSSPCHISLKL
jgi:hypothetical protein